MGWAPDDWDAMSKEIGVSIDLLKEVGLAFINKRGNAQDSFRARVLFPIFTDAGDAVAFGGRKETGITPMAHLTCQGHRRSEIKEILDKTHRNACHVGFDWHTCIHQCQTTTTNRCHRA